LAAPRQTLTTAPRGTDTPSTTTSRVAVRACPPAAPPSAALLDRAPHERTTSRSAVIAGIRQEPVEEVARRAVRRLGAGREEQSQEGEDLVVRQTLSVELRLREHAHEVVPGRRTARRQELGEVLAELLRRREPALDVHGDADELDREAVEARQVRVRQAEHAGDHLERERERQLADEVGAAALDERVDPSLDDRRDQVALPAVHSLLAECLLEQTPVPMVLGLVHLEDRVDAD
jgi:hypothetical protein